MTALVPKDLLCHDSGHNGALWLPKTVMSFILKTVLISACLVLATPAFAEDDIQEAIESVNRELAANPKDPNLLIRRSNLYRQKQLFDQAVADLNEAGRLGAKELEREKADLFLAAGWHETGLEHANTYIT